MRLRRLKALIVKEFQQVIRDPSTIIICVVLPTVLLLLYAFGVSLDFKNMKIGLVMEDTAPDAQSFAKALANSRYFDVEIARDRRGLEKKIIDGTINGMVVIPSYFSQFREKPEAHIAPLQVIADGTNPNTASFVQNYVSAAFQGWEQIQRYESNWEGQPLIQVETRYWYNESLDSRNFILPGSLAITMTLIGTLLSALVIAREWERGTMEGLMATSVKIFEFILAKLLTYFFLGLLTFTLLTLVTIFIFNVPFRGSILALGFAASVFLFTAIGLGLFISTISKNQLVASQAAINTGFLPAYMLSGFLFEISTMPEPIRLLTYAMPARYFVTSLQTLFLAGNVWPLLLRDIGIMAGIAVLFYFLAARRTVKRLD